MVRALLDTNVVSELQRQQCAPQVRACVDEFDEEELFLSVITLGEIVKGIALLPIGKRRRELVTWKLGLEHQFSSHILSVDSGTAERWGELSANVQLSGSTISVEDGLIAATALRHGLHVMTRNTRHFSATGTQVINPWEW